VVLVGAMLVSSMETVWAGEVRPSKTGDISVTDYHAQDISLDGGAEMGRFNMGSTVIVLLPPGVVEGLPDFAAGDAVKVGQQLATLL
jgi:phosphatidylserine decarboxylase